MSAMDNVSPDHVSGDHLSPDHVSPDHGSPDHVSNDLLVRSIDDELSSSEIALLESHLVHCHDCRRRRQDLRSLSVYIEKAVAASVPVNSNDARESLARCLDTRRPGLASLRPRKTVQRFGWAMGLAATLTVGMLIAPHFRQHRSTDVAAQSQSASALEVDGETFVRLPYSNPDLPLNSPHVVQMQVPVSSLADAGIVFEPISTEMSAPDRSVLADVLIGIDGQPLGVHVLSVE